MKFFKPVNPDEIPFTNYGKILDILNQIEHTDYEAVEIDWKALNHNAPASSVSIFVNAIRRKGLPFKAIMRDDRVFIVKMKGE